MRFSRDSAEHAEALRGKQFSFFSLFYKKIASGDALCDGHLQQVIDSFLIDVEVGDDDGKLLRVPTAVAVVDGNGDIYLMSAFEHYGLGQFPADKA